MAFIMLINAARQQQMQNAIKQRVFRDRLHPLDAYDDMEIIRRYRLSREIILELYDLIRDDLDPKTQRNHAIPGLLQLFCALRYYASGTLQHVIGDSIGIQRSSVSRIITRVTNSICAVRRRYITFPQTRDSMQQVAEGFYQIANFPRVLGAIDRTLIDITAPRINEHLFVSRKGGHSINILAICDANLKFTYVVAKYPGSTNDSFIWLNSNLNAKFENHDIEGGWLLGDSG